MNEKITDTELLRDAIWDDREGYSTIEETIIEQTRWAVLVRTVFKREADGKLFMMTWRKAATESQEHEFPDEAVECEAYQETITNYREI